VETLLWTITLILGVPSALLIALNWLSFVGWLIAAMRGHEGAHSFAPPLLCGIAGGSRASAVPGRVHCDGRGCRR
jgi:hypothetical protein